jgi:hypothetical protein
MSGMRDLEKALTDISAIRSQIAAATAFRGYGPAALAATGGVALVTMIAQAVFLDHPTANALLFFGSWIATAFLSAAIIGIEMHGRSRRLHSDLADVMIYNAIEQFLPAGAAGALLLIVFARFIPESLWMLPGLWQILVSLGIFASLRALPRGVALGGAWYFITGFAALWLASATETRSPWTMGLPFVVGQLLIAAILHFSATPDENDED